LADQARPARIPARPTRKLSFIASAAEFTPKNVQTAKERVKLVYRVKIGIPDPDLELKPGTPADADMSRHEQAVAVMAARANGKLLIWSAGIVAVLFGLLTVREGGAVLFWSEPARRAAGQYVPFVVWFNFLAGFAYVAAGSGLWFRQRWAAGLAFLIAAATQAVFVAFGAHIASGGGYEMRTVIAMSLRSAVWIAITVVSYRLVWTTGGRGGL
jgi:hypothetical protein